MTNRYDDGYAAGKAAASWVEYPDSARGLGERGDRLTAACRPYGSVDLYVGDDGRVYAS